MGKKALFQDDYENRKGIPALAFCGIEISDTKPLSIKYPKQITTIGDHIRAKRFELELRQVDVAGLIDVKEESITNWENNLTEPEIRYMPAIIRFLGYNPFSFDIKVFGSKIKYIRYSRGLTHNALGKFIGVNASTIGSWEKGEHHPQKNTQKIVDKKVSLLIRELYSGTKNGRSS